MVREEDFLLSVLISLALEELNVEHLQFDDLADNHSILVGLADVLVHDWGNMVEKVVSTSPSLEIHLEVFLQRSISGNRRASCLGLLLEI